MMDMPLIAIALILIFSAAFALILLFALVLNHFLPPPK